MSKKYKFDTVLSVKIKKSNEVHIYKKCFSNFIF